MRWKAAEASSPHDGDTRWTLKFAFLPKRSNDGYVYWLQDVYVRQEYKVFLYSGRWIDLEYAGSLSDSLRRNT